MSIYKTGDKVIREKDGKVYTCVDLVRFPGGSTMVKCESHTDPPKTRFFALNEVEAYKAKKS